MQRISWGRPVVAAVLLGATWGCADGPEVVRRADSVTKPESEFRSLNLMGTRAELEGRPRRTAEEELLLGDVCRQLGDLARAERAYYDARSASSKAVDGEYRALTGLARVALARGDGAMAVAMAGRAEALVPGDSAREEVRAISALGHALRGQVGEARRLRAQITRGDLPEIAELDRRLAAAATPREPTPGPAPATRPAPTDFGSGAPPIQTRDRWGAKPVNPKRDPVPIGTIRRITVHHTAEQNLPGPSFAENAERMRSYQSTHQNERRWADIGYHFVIDRQARIWEGRSLAYQGAHAGSAAANEGNVGIALIGDFERSQPTAAQKRSLYELAEWLMMRYGIHSQAVYGHDEVAKRHDPKEGTTCPGKHLARYIVELKRQLARSPAASRR
jgi:hypothetical protein